MDSKVFFDTYRSYFGKLTQGIVDNINFFNKKVIEDQARFTLNEWAYVYATVIWETGYTFGCVKEGLNKSEEWRQKYLARYYPYYGRGYVQLTWQRNYELFSKRLGIDLVSRPELALLPEYAFKILVEGCEKGLFTGIKLKGIKFEEYYSVNNGKQLGSQYARRVINGIDKAKEISEIYKKFVDILTKSMYKVYPNV